MQPIHNRLRYSWARQRWSVLALVLGACSSTSGIQSTDAVDSSAQSTIDTQQPAAAIVQPQSATESVSVLEAEQVDESPPNGNDQTASQSQTDNVLAEAPVACSSMPTQIETRALVLINAARAEARFCGEQYFPAAPALRWNTLLYEAAHAHSEDMAGHNFFSHTGSSGSAAGQRISSTGYSWSAVAENIAAGQIDVRSAIDGWIDSPGHCQNLMNTDYRDVAVACVEDAGSDFARYWTQTFGNAR